jgi:hypothetical protein
VQCVNSNHGAELQRYLNPISKLGGKFENGNGSFFSVDITPGVSVSKIYKLLEKGEKGSIWAFEEGYYSGK